MCFSTMASFTAAAALTAIGIGAALQVRSRSQVLLALIPFIFAFHQLIEGLQWINLQSCGCREMSLALGYIYMFIAGAFWPIWVPLSLLPLEKRHKTRLLLLLCASTLFAIGYTFGSLHKIDPRIVGCHLFYFQTSPAYILLYCALTAIPFFLISVPQARYFKIFGTLIFLTLGISAWISYQCALSIWCFFAAINSLWLIVVLKKLN
jgi:hypothetical protein